MQQPEEDVVTTEPPSPASLQGRLAGIDAGLKRLGATRAYCRGYFGSLAGRCEETRACACVRHVMGAPCLPEGMVCSQAFGMHLAELKGRLKWVGVNTAAYRQQWQDVRSEEAAEGFMQPRNACNKVSQPCQ